MLAHNNLISGEREQRATGHGIMRHEHRNLAFMFENGARDLRCGQNQSARRVQHQVQGNFRIRHMNRPQDFFAIVDVDVTKQRKAE